MWGRSRASRRRPAGPCRRATGAGATFPRGADPLEFDRLFDALRRGGLNSYTTQESAPGGVDASLRLVRSGLAVSLKLESEVRALRDIGVVWRPLDDPSIDVVITAAWRADQLGPAGRRLVEILRQARMP